MLKKKAIISQKSNKTAERKTGKAVKKIRRAKKNIATVTGMRDILPQDQKYWEKVRQVAKQISIDYGYDRIDTPVLELTELFVRGVGAQTDIVEKEMFSFTDQGGDNLVLRPEFTAAAVRAYIQHGMLNQIQPVKFFYLGPLFRHEKPQSGRYRQFFQFGFEAIGEENPALDAQLILMGWNSLNDLGIESVIQVNSIGCMSCREEYKKVLVKYYKAKAKLLCESCKTRLTKNPLRLLDCKESGCQELKDDAPQILDYLDDNCKEHFMKVVGYLDELDLPYVLNPYIVRGLDYYNRTIFEYWAIDDVEGKNALGGGGRYDGLVTMLGGREDTPACGLAMGLDRIVAKMREKNIEVPDKRVDVFVAQLGDAAKKKAMLMYENLRPNGSFTIAQAFHKDSLKKQLELANKMKVKFTLIIGQKEVGEGTIMLRDMQGGVQEVIDFNKIEKELKKRLEKYREGAVIDLTADEEEKESSTEIPEEDVADLGDLGDDLAAV
ncbi:MAG: histidine--tRNA ligase [Candidatus Buchananbacteria bacterium RIFCSPHIGHO2_02_FULL_40_13]|uniref:Histidine--tRNA ligase n=1 Tax=Candidatus Buchananbacteria bacterium RIFCSPLOWO2_01_FULL_39_33 TaxID=1797543 RepID=A0A1G1YJE9_9BACT|nr:MAG: histidine--tRNA ligase [Candidatus Buchananbacteria bacterium RIFCSPHIGHO2_01_FULL_40_35]OGY49913.1 MAG: histidine--tRNA ligase [Candidatus Buchananbacteria bacterium RIFCSPHIGHO2_02_FULL_40_13]OGY51946.1 MAG: histidine--tRNA ligase [Candidatus Buchananbacteria bacterium RIFCSPLOWO2_01_FULL_39_33]